MQVVTQMAWHVDTVCGMKQVYNNKVKICYSLLSKMLELIKIEPKKFGNIVDIINRIIIYFRVGPTVTNAHGMD